MYHLLKTHFHKKKEVSLTHESDFKFHVSPLAGAANEGVLANFFNSLLSKKTGSPGSPGSGAVGAGVQGSAKKTGTISYSSTFTS